MKHFLNLWDLTADQMSRLLDDAIQMKTALTRGERPPILAGRVLGLVFEKPSLRTRASFQAAMAQMGGSSIFLSATDGGIGVRESVPDFARTLSEYVDTVALRTFKQSTIDEFAEYSRCPVINALSDTYHPCQALGDLLTVREVFGTIEGKTIAFIGDGNNVARSLAIGCAKLGARFILAAPDGYEFDEPFLKLFRKLCKGGELTQNGKPAHAVKEADIVYTDVWTSMGQETEQKKRKKSFAGYQVNSALMAKAPPRARFMHCLPAHRGEEVADDVLDGERSVAFQQAGNRMHAQKALLKWLMLEGD